MTCEYSDAFPGHYPIDGLQLNPIMETFRQDLSFKLLDFFHFDNYFRLKPHQIILGSE